MILQSRCSTRNSEQRKPLIMLTLANKTVVLDSIVLCCVFGPFGALFSSPSSAHLCAEVPLHTLSITKRHCDDGRLGGHKLLQWPSGQRNYCVTHIKSFREVWLAASGFQEDRMTDRIMGCWSALNNKAVSECRSCFSVKCVIFKTKQYEWSKNQQVSFAELIPKINF